MCTKIILCQQFSCKVCIYDHQTFNITGIKAQGLNCKKSAQNKPIFTAFTTFMEQKRMCLDRLYFVDRVNTKYRHCILLD